MKRKFPKALQYIFLLGVCLNLSAKQNTILIIADDLSSDYLGCFSTTTDTAIAPNIHALAKRGIKFSKAWATPVCSPTRAGILTGRYSFRTGIGSVVVSATSPQLDTSETSIAKLLKYYAPTSYNTACVGKWNLHVATPPQRIYPNKMGFDFYAGNFNGQLTNYYSYPRIKNGILDTVNTYATTQTVNDAIGWMDTMNTNKPFFLWLAFNAPHSPFHIPPSDLCNTTGLTGTTGDINTNPEKYFKAAIQAMDTEIGRLLLYLSNRNLLDSTTVIFIGDNGNETAVAQNTNPSRAKATLYDYGSRVPVIIAGPPVVNPGRTSTDLVNTTDLFATIAELCNFPNWKSYIPSGRTIDSKSMLPIIKNTGSPIRDWIFTEQFNSPVIPEDGKTIRNIDYHLLRFDNGAEEFYNQTADPQENNNLLSGTLSGIDNTNYISLCDSLAVLTGSSPCQTTVVDIFNTPIPDIVYTNPTQGALTLNPKGNVRLLNIKLYNSNRQLLIETSSNNINVTAFSAGIYFMEINTDKGVFTKKIILQR